MTDNQKNKSDNADERRERALTDQDVEALVAAMEGRLLSRFYNNLGHGVWDLVWRVMILAIFAVAAWGAWLEVHGR